MRSGGDTWLDSLEMMAGLLDDPKEGGTERGSPSAGEQHAVGLVLYIF